MRSFGQAAEDLVAAGRRFDARGWVLGTSGNFSEVIAREPLRLAITRSGVHKGALTPDDILEIDSAGTPVRAGAGRPSAETQLHLEIAAARHAGAIMHTHSVWSTLLSDRGAVEGGIAIDGYEMLKGLDGISTHEHREWIPIVDNDQDIPRLSLVVRRILDEHPGCHGFLLRRHGLYTWGATLPDAVRHVEILEFLLESVGRAGSSRAIREEAAPWRS
jgi:methylthioribulose-1-phosphate dehydratase